MNKHDLLHKIKSLENLSQDERAYLINLVNRQATACNRSCKK
jgi:hypothetical protein